MMAMRVVPLVSKNSSLTGILEDLGWLQLCLSLFRPECDANQRIFQWRGATPAPTSALSILILQHLAQSALQAFLKDASGYGVGLLKFHLFCNVFNIPKEDRLPASYNLLFAFVLWACSSPDPNDPVFMDSTPFKPVSVVTTRKYLSAVQAWHLAQGWPALLLIDNHKRMGYHLCGVMQQNGLHARQCMWVRPSKDMA
jgi:hypothetical protein